MKKFNLRKLNYFGYIFLVIYCIMYFSQLNLINKNYFILFQFLIIGIIAIYTYIRDKSNISFTKITCIFIFVFLFLAPLQQYSSNVILWENQTYSDMDFIYANFVIIIFEIAILLCQKKKIKTSKIVNKYKPSNDFYIVLLAYSLICTLILLLTNNIFDNTPIINSMNIDEQLKNILRIPSYASLLTYMIFYTKNNKRLWFIIPTFLQFILIYNLMYGILARYLIFSLYLSIIFYLLRNYKIDAWIFAIFVFAFSFIFSQTRLNGNIFEIFNSSINFNHVDFDAYQMLMSTIQYTKFSGFSFGSNIFSAILFLIPRTMLKFKNLPTGEIVFSYFENNFTNVSCPLMAEFFYAFGYIGVFVLAFITYQILSRLDKLIYSTNYFKVLLVCTLLGFMIYILRGALLNSVAYLGGIFIGLIPIMIIYKIMKKNIISGDN